MLQLFEGTRQAKELISIQESEIVVSHLPSKGVPAPDVSTGGVHQTFKDTVRKESYRL